MKQIVKHVRLLTVVAERAKQVVDTKTPWPIAAEKERQEALNQLRTAVEELDAFEKTTISEDWTV